MVQPFLDDDLLTLLKDYINVPLDAGPKMYYASKTDEDIAKEVMTLLHCDLTDAINILFFG